MAEDWPRAAALLREHRFTVAVVFPVVGGALLVASAEGWLDPPLQFNPALILLGTAVMRLPLVVALGPLVDRRAGLALGALAAFTYTVETVGVATGLPYGEFTYGVGLGPMIAGAVPVGLPLFFPPLVLNGYLLALLLWPVTRRRRGRRIAAAVAVVLAIDLVLDPGAVALGFWRYAAGGAYYGVPLTNYAGWLFSAAVAVALVDVAFDPAAVTHRVRTCEFALDDLVSFVLLWGGVNAYFGNLVPVGIAALGFAALVRAGRFDFDVLCGVPG